jgi:hypothetical protein
MRGRWQMVARWVAVLVLIAAVAGAALWLLSWAIVVNDADRTPSAYQDQP